MSQNKPMSKESELLKIQVYADYCHTVFTLKASVLVSGFVGLLLILLGLLYQALVSGLVFYFGSLITLIVFAPALYYTFRSYHNDLNQIQGFLSKIEKKEPLPEFKDMRKR
jgi:hypothetical protein